MNGGLSREEWRSHLERLGQDLQGAGLKVSLVLLGSVPSILQGQKARTTIDLDVWKPKSNFDAVSLRRATEQAGVELDAIRSWSKRLKFILARPHRLSAGKFA